MKKLLITGFEPFGDEQINPSWEAVKRLPDTIGAYQLTKLCVPVVFGKAAEFILQTAKQLSPDAVLCIGEAGGRIAITPELVAINFKHATIPDNDGNQPINELIIPDGKTAYFSTLPVQKMTDSIKTSNLLSQTSYSAGVYVCNDVLYSLLSHFESTATRVGFIHIPYCTEQNKTPSMPLNDIIKGLVCAIEAI